MTWEAYAIRYGRHERTAQTNHLMPLADPHEAMPLDYFIVNLSHGSPIDKHGFNILQFFDFPHENRSSMPSVSGYWSSPL